MKPLLIFLAVALTLTACCQTANDGSVNDSSSTLAYESSALRDDIAQMLLVGFRGTELKPTSHIYRDIKDYHIGGVILFEYDAPTGTRKRNIANPSQVKKLCTDLQSLQHETLLIGIDQEGGYVARLRPSYGFPKIISAKQMAQGGPDSVYHYAQLTAQTLHHLGINLNFAPCVDVDVNPSCPVIGAIERSFSSGADVVAQHARTWLTVQQEHHVAGCLKHFPGHGSSQSDTHKGLVVIGDHWSHEELLPYQQLIADSIVPMVMTAHVINKKIDPTLPASLSPKYTQILRQDYHYNGVIITDDIAMGAITKQYSYATAIKMALQAGADMLCISNNGTTYDSDIVPKTIHIIEELIRNGNISQEQIQTSAKRIRQLKQSVAH